MNRALRWTLFAVFGGGLALGGARSAAHAPSTTAALAPSAATAGRASAAETVPPAEPAPPATEQHGAGQTSGGRRDPLVFIDGKAVAVLRRAELPLGMKPFKVPGTPFDQERYFSLGDYVRGLGIQPAKVKSIQFLGTHDRWAMITGSELERFESKLYFDFTQEVRGKPRARWQTGMLAEKTRIDIIQVVAIYTTKKPPTANPNGGGLFLDGQLVDGIPYASNDVPKGSRVLVDGKIAGWAKRRQMSAALEAADSTPDKAVYSLAAFMKSLGVDASRAKAVDFVFEDDLLERFEGSELSKVGSLTFVVARRSHGAIHVRFPDGRTAAVSSVQVFTAVPPARKVDELGWEYAIAATEPGGEGDRGGGRAGGAATHDDDG